MHRELGPGLLESACEICLARELSARGVPFARQVELPVSYKGEMFDAGFRIDLVVADRVIVELKSIEKVLGIHESQLQTYMRLADKRPGLLINFNVQILKNGITRRVL